jgi:3-hydroxyacyl-[acyl-carrier-protein] dehydratase
MDQQAKCVAPLNHPSYQGHFPGNPVVPGVLLLDLVIQALGRGVPSAISSVKFHQVLKPGEAFELAWKSAGTRSSFRCTRGAVLLADGSLEYGSAAP